MAFPDASIVFVLCLLCLQNDIEAGGGSEEVMPQSLLAPEVKEGSRDQKFLNLFAIEKVTTLFENRKAECDSKFQGSYIKAEDLCLRYVPENIEFEEAVDRCTALGGKLWIPDFTNPDQISNIASEFPLIYSITNRDIWVGVRALGGRLITIDGQDVTDTYLGLLSDITTATSRNDGCVILNLQNGFPRYNVAGCTAPALTDFFCEFTLETKDSLKSQKYFKFMKPFMFKTSI